MSPPPDSLVIASRGSRLALRQAAIVSELVRRAHPSIDVQINTVKTTGDKDQRAFAAIGGKGLFVTEVEREVQEGRADVAVHSAKDLTAQIGDGCMIVCIPKRAGTHDVVVGGDGDSGLQRLESLARGARVGTSSMRRRALLGETRPDLEAAELRGNIDTRLQKVADGVVDAAILAAAGLERLGALDRAAPLEPQTWVPAPGQGALAVEARADRPDIAALFEDLNDHFARAEVICERAFAARLEGGCSVPLGCYAEGSGERLVVTGYLGHPDGGQGLRDKVSGPMGQGEELGIELADAILAAGGHEILADLKAIEAPEVTGP